MIEFWAQIRFWTFAGATAGAIWLMATFAAPQRPPTPASYAPLDPTLFQRAVAASNDLALAEPRPLVDAAP